MLFGWGNNSSLLFFYLLSTFPPLQVYLYSLHPALKLHRTAQRRNGDCKQKQQLSLQCKVSVCSWHLFRFLPILTLPRFLSFFVPPFVSSFANIYVQNQQVIQQSGMTERLLLVQEQLPSPFNYSGDARISLPPCLSESKRSHLAYFTAASFSSPFFVLTLIRLDLFHQALLRPSMHMSIPRSAERGHIKATTMLPSPNRTALSTSYLVCSTQSLPTPPLLFVCPSCSFF